MHSSPVVPQYLLYAFLVLGFVNFSRSFLRTLRMLLQTFVIPGKSASSASRVWPTACLTRRFLLVCAAQEIRSW